MGIRKQYGCGGLETLRSRNRSKRTQKLTIHDIEASHERLNAQMDEFVDLIENSGGKDGDKVSVRARGKGEAPRGVKEVVAEKGVKYVGKAKRREDVTYGNPPMIKAGRHKGVRNKSRALIADAAIIAAEKVGMEFGRYGLISYLENAARKYPQEYLRFLGRLIPLHAKIHTEKSVEFVDKVEIVGLEAPKVKKAPVLTVNKDDGSIEEVNDVKGSDDVIIPMMDILRCRVMGG